MLMASEQGFILRFVLLFCKTRTGVVWSQGRQWRQFYKLFRGQEYLVRMYRIR